MQLSEIIIKKIKNDGPISFQDFMEMSLYYPDLGYYNSTPDKIGILGDFLTSPSISPVFGELIGKQIEEMWHLLEKKPFTIVEYGAGTGALCNGALNYLKNNDDLYSELNYCIIEKSSSMRKKAKEYLSNKVSWYDNIQSIPNINGCVLSNELVDNFAVHRVIMKKELMEVYVDYKDGFVEILKPASKELVDYLKELKVELFPGFKTEINLEATKWICQISDHLKKGYVITIDYGYPSYELYDPQRKDGTLTCYNKHKKSNNPYHDIGSQDITSHVNFSALCLWGYKNGLDFCGYTDQLRFLASLGFEEHLKKSSTPGQEYKNFKKERFLTQTLLYEMGDKFKVLVQQKGLPKQQLLGLTKVL
ncbi:MAG: class I SAM-dependent methyltransferase [Bacteroidia bacterium]